MKKILSILLIFAFSLNVPAPNPNVNRRLIYCKQQYGTYTKAYYNVVKSNNGNLTRFELKALTQYENNIGGDILFFDRLWIHGLSNKTAAKVSFVYPSSTLITEVNNPVYTQYQGFSGNGTTSYYNLNYNLSTSSLNYTRNNGFFGVYQNIANSINGCLIGALGGTETSAIYRISGSVNAYINYVGGAGSVVADNGLGLISVKRTTSTHQIYVKNGIGGGLNTSTSAALINGNMFLFARSFSGSPSSFSNGRISLTFISSASINQLNFYNASQNLGLKLGWGL